MRENNNNRSTPGHISQNRSPMLTKADDRSRTSRKRSSQRLTARSGTKNARPGCKKKVKINAFSSLISALSLQGKSLEVCEANPRFSICSHKANRDMRQQKGVEGDIYITEHAETFCRKRNVRVPAETSVQVIVKKKPADKNETKQCLLGVFMDSQIPLSVKRKYTCVVDGLEVT